MRNDWKPFSALPALAVLPLAIACSPGSEQVIPLESSEVSQRATSQTRSAVDGLLEVTSEIDETASISLALGTFDALGGACESAARDPFDAGDEPSPARALEEILSEASRFLSEHVFREELVESQSDSSVEYRVDPADACDGDAECVRDLTEHPLRFVVTGDDTALDVDVLVGEERDHPFSFHVSDTRLALVGDLEEIADVLSSVPEHPPELPDVLTGSIEVAIDKHAEQDFSLSWSVLSAVEVSNASDEGLVSVRVAASRATTEARFNAAERTFSLSQNLAPVDVSVPGAWLCGGEDGPCADSERNGQYEVHVGGLNGVLAIDGDEPERLLLRDLGLGDETSTLTLGGNRFASADVNRDAGRRFSMEFTEVDEGVSVRFEPSLNLAVAVSMLELSDGMQAEMPEWLMDEVFDVSLGGAPRNSVLIRRPERCAATGAAGSGSDDAELEVVEGTLSFIGTSMASNVQISAGQCLVPDPEPASEHPFDQLSAGACR